MFKYQVIHNQKFEEEKFFNKKELGEILITSKFLNFNFSSIPKSLAN